MEQVGRPKGRSGSLVVQSGIWLLMQSEHVHSVVESVVTISTKPPCLNATRLRSNRNMSTSQPPANNAIQAAQELFFTVLLRLYFTALQAYECHMVRHPRRVFINYNWINQLSNTTIWWLDICCLITWVSTTCFGSYGHLQVDRLTTNL